ncbi:hypothetical protein HMPREF0281_00538 [Corynebacterium ammoniagenes DSM 20306]|uniref:Uncharacterized protein n=1 Tax=Corynebacterium ammoniagenes DSM 20306 TaxID=649754 RepID=A0ABN0AH39_CORAM|nr:hypothetical protein HMPREF0281_00538 [Corynebacterium ammoniagenes DSM 20306]
MIETGSGHRQALLKRPAVPTRSPISTSAGFSLRYVPCFLTS